MRSKLGTRARLAAHIAALVLLILMLVYLDSPQRRGLDWESLGAIRPAGGGVAAQGDPAATLERPVGAGRGSPVPEDSLRPPETVAAAESAPAPAPTPVAAAAIPVSEPVPEPVTEPTPAAESAPAPASDPEEEAAPEAAAAPTPVPEPAPTPVSELATGPEPEPEPESAAEAEPAPEAEAAPALEAESTPEAEPEPIPAPEAAPVATPEPTPEPVSEPALTPPATQPDESGAIVVAATGPAGTVSRQAAAPLPNANLEVLADGVYWLAPGRDLGEELAAVPELGSLVLLTPLPGYKAEGFEHVRSTAIPADTTDLTADAAEHFLHLVRTGPRPVVAAALPGARGAAFFKGAYLILERGMSTAEALAGLEPELADAGRDRDEIAHRLAALAAQPPL